jgi:hypothetical protein
VASKGHEHYEGDFALLNPLPVLTDEDGTYHCPMPVWNRTWDDNDNVTTAKALCGEEMWVEWRMVCPVPEAPDVIEAKDAGTWAYGSSWELKCCNGHVVATSAETDGREDAQAFDPRRIWR